MTLRAFSFSRRLLLLALLCIAAGCGGGATPPQLPALSGAQSAAIAPHSLQPAIIVANFSGANILEFPLGAKGNVAPNVTIGGPKTGIGHADNVALDASDHIYASLNGSEIAVFGANAQGDVKPLYKIAGANTQIVLPIGVAVDSKGYVYVSDCGTGNVKVFAPGSRGNVFPVRVIQLSSGCTIEVALDAHDHLYVTSGDDLISEYSSEASGSQLLRTIVEQPPSGGVGIRSIAVDSHGYVYAGNLLAKDIRVFSRFARGDAKPVRTISGSNTHLGAASGLAIDKPSDNLYVTVCRHCSEGSGTDSILLFPPGADGNVKPSAVITGTKTLLDAPTDLTIRQ